MMTQVKRKVAAGSPNTEDDRSISGDREASWTPLRRHADDAAHSDYRVEAQVLRTSPRNILIAHRVHGRVDSLKIAAPGAPSRADDLWRTTCFEAFIRIPHSVSSGGAAYWEVNASPSRQWATYAFSDYRAGRERAEEIVVSKVEIDRAADRFQIVAYVSLSESLEKA
ncbi:MAG: hypothetical protein AAGC77_06860, partial [Pseudomonadota bacterium]